MQERGCFANKHSDEPMKIREILFKDKILLYAILLSAAWHIFCISAVKVVVVPKMSRPVKFSGVAFLGPILDKGSLQMGVTSHERSASEKRAMDFALTLPAVFENEEYGLPDRSKPWVGDRALTARDESLTALAIEAIDTPKMNPGRDVD